MLLLPGKWEVTSVYGMFSFLNFTTVDSAVAAWIHIQHKPFETMLKCLNHVVESKQTIVHKSQKMKRFSFFNNQHVACKCLSESALLAHGMSNNVSNSPWNCDFDAKTIYCAAPLQTVGPLAAEFQSLCKGVSDLQLVHLRLLTRVAHLVCRRVSTVYYLVNHCFPWNAVAVTLWTLSRGFVQEHTQASKEQPGR